MLEALLPITCFACGLPVRVQGLCDGCYSEVETIAPPVCIRCGIPIDYVGGEGRFEGQVNRWGSVHSLCESCTYSQHYFFSKARSCAVYDGHIRDMLLDFKYNKNRPLEVQLVSFFIDTMPHDINRKPDLVVPVPLHIKRLLKREFNQASIIAEGLAKHLGVLFNPMALKRMRDTKPQAEMRGLEEKRENVSGAFCLRSGTPIEGRAVLLIDDILTTGSTADECSRVLIEAGAEDVEVLTLLRAGAYLSTAPLGGGGDSVGVDF